MAKAREKVQQSGFWDPEVKESAHDTICMWAYNHAETILRFVHGDEFDREWDIGRDVAWIPDHRDRPDNFEELLGQFAAQTVRPNPRIFDRELEAVLTSHIGHRRAFEQRIGFADLLIVAHDPKIEPVSNVRGRGSLYDEFTIGWPASCRVLVEAKSALPTLGELMRQLRHYRTAHSGPMVVVAPDDKYETILSEQGIGFIRFDE